MRRQRRGLKLLALITGISLLAVSCGGDDDDDDTGASDEGQQGGEFVDLQTFCQGGPDNIDPALSTSVSESQVGLSLYDGLTDTDYSDIENPEVVGKVAESWEPNDDNTVWTFTVREGLKFSDGTDVLPSSFVRAWERASDPDFAGDYSYLFSFIDGGQEKLDGEAEELTGVKADDEAMTLEVTLSAPYNNFDAVAGFKLFHPMPEAVDELDDQGEWQTGEMVGNGPFMIEEAWDGESGDIVVVPNPEWDGTKYDEALGLPEQPFLERLTFTVSQDIDAAYASFEAGEGNNACFPPGRYNEAQENYETTIDTPIMGAYYFGFDFRDEVIGGEENKLLRQAISQAINREEINEQVYEGSRTTATGVTPEGIPGWEEGLCDYCAYDKEAAQKAFDDWTAAGNELAEPLPIQLNADAGHEPVVNIIIDNLKEIGIEATAQPIPSDEYFGQLAEGACVVCRSGWILDYPTYDNFMFDLFHQTSLDGNNNGYMSDKFDALVDEAKAETDPETAAELNREAEQVLLNEDIGVIPINWYRGGVVYDGNTVAELEQMPTMNVPYELVQMK